MVVLDIDSRTGRLRRESLVLSDALVGDESSFVSVLLLTVSRLQKPSHDLAVGLSLLLADGLEGEEDSSRGLNDAEDPLTTSQTLSSSNKVASDLLCFISIVRL